MNRPTPTGGTGVTRFGVIRDPTGPVQGSRGFDLPRYLHAGVCFVCIHRGSRCCRLDRTRTILRRASAHHTADGMNALHEHDTLTRCTSLPECSPCLHTHTLLRRGRGLSPALAGAVQEAEAAAEAVEAESAANGNTDVAPNSDVKEPVSSN